MQNKAFCGNQCGNGLDTNMETILTFQMETASDCILLRSAFEIHPKGLCLFPALCFHASSRAAFRIFCSFWDWGTGNSYDRRFFVLTQQHSRYWMERVWRLQRHRAYSRSLQGSLLQSLSERKEGSNCNKCWHAISFYDGRASNRGGIATEARGVRLLLYRIANRHTKWNRCCAESNEKGETHMTSMSQDNFDSSDNHMI